MASYFWIISLPWRTSSSLRQYRDKCITDGDSYYSGVADGRGAAKCSGDGSISVVYSHVNPRIFSIFYLCVQHTRCVQYDLCYELSFLDCPGVVRKILHEKKKWFSACNFTTSLVQNRERSSYSREVSCTTTNRCRFSTTFGHGCVCAGTSRCPVPHAFRYVVARGAISEYFSHLTAGAGILGFRLIGMMFPLSS